MVFFFYNGKMGVNQVYGMYATGDNTIKHTNYYDFSNHKSNMDNNFPQQTSNFFFFYFIFYNVGTFLKKSSLELAIGQ